MKVGFFTTKAIAAFIFLSATPFLLNAQTANSAWSAQLGGISNEGGGGIAADASGNVYSTGSFKSTADFDPGVPTQALTALGNNEDVYVSKLDPNGNYVWAIQIGDTSSDVGNAIAVDNAGFVYVAGTYTGNVDFEPGSGVTELTGGGVFVTKFDNNGIFVWAKQLAGAFDEGNGVAVDASGNVFVVGAFSGTKDFDPSAVVSNLVSATAQKDIFVVKLNATGDFQWARRAGDMWGDFARGVCTDGAGNAIVAGVFRDTVDFNPSSTADFFLNSDVNSDGFLWKLDTDGNFLWAVEVGSASNDIVYSVSTDAANNVYAAGVFKDTVDFDPGSGEYNLTFFGEEDGFVWKLDLNGGFIWAKQIGGTWFDYARAIDVNPAGYSYITGWFYQTADFDPDPVDTFKFTSAGVADIFIMQLEPNGDFAWAKRMGGTGGEGSMSIAVDDLNNALVTGTFNGIADLNSNATDTLLFDPFGINDIYVHKISVDLPLAVEEPKPANDINIFPNPTDGIFTVTMTDEDGVRVDIYDMMGALAQSQYVATNNLVVNLEDRAAGLYVVKITKDKDVATQKIIKQ